MKWQPCERREGVFSYDDADGAVAWAKANQMPMRGHALLWATGASNIKSPNPAKYHPGTQMPSWLDNYSGTELATKVEKRIDDALSHFNGSLTGWDVNNEMTHGEVLLSNTNDPDIRCLLLDCRILCDFDIQGQDVPMGSPEGPQLAALCQRLRHHIQSRKTG